MLLDEHEKNGLLFNKKFKSATSNANTFAYRGELILIEGEVADDQGRRKPPVAIVRHAVLLEKNNKLYPKRLRFRCDSIPFFAHDCVAPPYIEWLCCVVAPCHEQKMKRSNT